jgi:two-component system, OmpR family, response regulator
MSSADVRSRPRRLGPNRTHDRVHAGGGSPEERRISGNWSLLCTILHRANRRLTKYKTNFTLTPGAFLAERWSILSGLPRDRSDASVLVVDDETGAREALRLILGYEFRVLTAETGERALEIVQERDVDVVVLDLHLPGLSGWDTFERIGKIKPETEIVIVTGHGSYPEAVKALHHHAFDFVTKPFDVNQVLQTVHRAASFSQTRREWTSRRTLHTLTTELAQTVEELSPTVLLKLSEDERLQWERIRNLARTVLGFSVASDVAR